jgi:outer membrane receptor protein involved in Fe transport
VPYNIYTHTLTVQPTVQQGVTQAALNYLQTPGFSNGETTEQVISGSVSGDLGQFSPWADESLGIAIGAEYRKESLDFNVDEAFRTGDLAGQGGPTLPNEGGYDVKEVFGEVRVPIVSDAPFFNELSLEAGYRYSDYSQSSPNTPTNSFNTDTWKLGAEWSPVEALRIRGSWNRAVRAPNLVELYTSAGLGLFAGTDPCAGEEPAFTAAQCARTGVTAAQYGTIDPNPAAQYNALLAGNPDLTPESADTYTLGVVIQPRGLLSGFTASIDAFEINVDDYIVVGGLPQSYLLACGLSGNADYCSRIIRNPGTGRLDLTNLAATNGFIQSENINTGSQKARGIDIAADYRMDLGEGGLSFAFTGTYFDKLETDTDIPIALSATATPTDKFDCAGYYGVTCGVPTPKWRHRFRVSYTAPSMFTASVNWRHIGSVKDEQTQTDNPYLSPGGAFYGENAKLKAHNYFDLAFSADVTEAASFRFGVNNIFDKEPPPVSQESLSGTFGSGNTYPQVYDYLGRYFFVGASFSF